MANYYCTYRTNYFKVTDENAFRVAMAKVDASDFDLWEERQKDGTLVFGFGGTGGIGGLPNENGEYDDDSFDQFIDTIQRYIAPDDACLLFESGSEGLRYVVGSVNVITNKSCEVKEIRSIGIELARKMLGNEKYDTRCEYQRGQL